MPWMNGVSASISRAVSACRGSKPLSSSSNRSTVRTSSPAPVSNTMDNAIWPATSPARRRPAVREPVATVPQRKAPPLPLTAAANDAPPQTTPARRVKTSPARTTGSSMATASARGTTPAPAVANSRRPTPAVARPSTNPPVASAKPSTSAARTSRPMPEPRAIRTANSRLRSTERPMSSDTVFEHATTSTSRVAAIDTRTTGRSSPSKASSTDPIAALHPSPPASRFSRTTRIASSRACANVAPSRRRPTTWYHPELSGATAGAASHTSTFADGNPNSAGMMAATS